MADVAVDPLIRLEDVSKVYGRGPVEVQALRHVRLRIASGEFVAVMGPSGSGKSTLMHILGCLDSPTAGRYWLAGDDVSQLDEEALAHVRNRRIGFVFQQFYLLEHLSAWRNVALPLMYAGVDPATRKRRALAALERVGLADRVEHRPNMLSGGQQQRVAIARALVTEPSIVLADEPTGNLDSAAAQEVLALLTELHQNGHTIVLITHDRDVAAHAERVLTIRDGVLEERAP
jgi:putative ABC transport system ATP-binding protein